VFTGLFCCPIRQPVRVFWIYAPVFWIILAQPTRSINRTPWDWWQQEKEHNHMALKATKEAVRAICSTDPSITAVQIRAALAELDGEGVREMQGEPPPRSYKRTQAAALLGVTPKMVSNYLRRGLLKGVYTGENATRATAISGESLRSLLEGRTPTAKEVA